LVVLVLVGLGILSMWLKTPLNLAEGNKTCQVQTYFCFGELRQAVKKKVLLSWAFRCVSLRALRAWREVFGGSSRKALQKRKKPQTALV